MLLAYDMQPFAFQRISWRMLEPFVMPDIQIANHQTTRQACREMFQFGVETVDVIEGADNMQQPIFRRYKCGQCAVSVLQYSNLPDESPEHCQCGYTPRRRSLITQL